jgi:hypothetical protein
MLCKFVDFLLLMQELVDFLSISIKVTVTLGFHLIVCSMGGGGLYSTQYL